MRRSITAASACFLLSGAVLAALTAPVRAERFTVRTLAVADEKAVFATVESKNVVPARARIGGTVAELNVRHGDRVERGQIVATIGDEKLVLQMKSLDAQIAGLEAQQQQTQTDLARAESLFERGTIPRARLDEARTAANVAGNALRARMAEKSVIQQQLSEGSVLAPTAGRVLRVPLTTGTVVLQGEPIATIAEGGFILRLQVPERHARFLAAGDTVRIDGAEIGQSAPRFGTIRLVYPQIDNGRVTADAEVEGLGDFFVGERLRVWIAAGTREAIVVPAAYIRTRFGMDYVSLERPGGQPVEVPVQRGRALPRPDMPDGIDILSGVSAGDVLVRP